MPKSKRDKKVSLTKTKSKGVALKQNLISSIRTYVEKYERIFVLSVENLRTVHLQEVRRQWQGSKIVFGKRRIFCLALGRNEKEEIHENLHKVSESIVGQKALLFTNEDEEKVLEWFDNFVEAEYARSGFKSQQTVILQPGTLEDFTSNMEPELRKLGLPIELKRGKIELREEYVVCKENDVLTPNQAKILKKLGHTLAEFKINVHSIWSKNGNFRLLVDPLTVVDAEENDMDQDEDDNSE